MGDSRESLLAQLERAKQSVRRRTVVDLGGGETTLGSTSKNRTTARDARSEGTSTLLSAKDNTREFVRYYFQLIKHFIADQTKYEMEVPKLNGYDRRVVHDIADKCNLSNFSVGQGESRVLRLKKDDFFFQDQDAVNRVDIEELIAKVGEKESSFVLRRVVNRPESVAPGQIGSYADEEALEKMERLRRATNEYTHATDMGYSNEELVGQEGEETVSSCRSLSSLASSHQLPMEPVRRLATCVGTRSPLSSPTEKGGSYTEVCRGCMSRVPITYPISQWKCEKYCAVCARIGIWRLEEHRQLAVTPKHSVATDTSFRKRAHEEGVLEKESEPRGLFVPEEIDKDDLLESENEEEWLMLDDVMDLVAANDYSLDDTRWLRQFAEAVIGDSSEEGRTVKDKAHGLQYYLAFCIDFEDVLSISVFKLYERRLERFCTSQKKNDSAEEDAVAAKRRRVESQSKMASPLRAAYIVIQEHKQMSIAMHQLLDKLLCRAFSLDDTSDLLPAKVAGHMALALPNASVYGVEAVVLCQLRPVVLPERQSRSMPVDREAILTLQKEYGMEHVYLADSLEDAVKRAGKSV